jgi:tetratricopeptide (TPR) repeat protein
MSVAQNQADERLRLRRVLPERAIALAMQNRWREAADVNRTILKIDPNDADAYNRLGKALLELGQIREAYDAYARAVELSPTNMIAQKNMQRLAPLVQQGATVAPVRAPSAGEPIRPQTFIEETGKTGLTILVNLASGPTLLTLTAGDRVALRVDGGNLLVYTSTDAGAYLGQVEPQLAHRLIKFIEAGNRYTAAVTTVSDKSLTILIREVYQAPTMQGRPSFPARAVPAAYRTAREGAPRYGGDDDDEGFGDDYDSDTDTDAEEPEEEAEFEDDEIDDR